MNCACVTCKLPIAATKRGSETNSGLIISSGTNLPFHHLSKAQKRRCAGHIKEGRVFSCVFGHFCSMKLLLLPWRAKPRTSQAETSPLSRTRNVKQLQVATKQKGFLISQRVKSQRSPWFAFLSSSLSLLHTW